MPVQGGSENKLPVFTTPQQQIVFFADDPLSSKQILTIYNPYEFLVKFRILCTDCSKYTVSAPQGVVKPHHTTDIVVQHKAVIPSNIGVSDTVRVQLYTFGHRTSGQKDIQITLLNSSQREKIPLPNLDTSFQQLEVDSADLVPLRQHPLAQERNTNGVIIHFCVIFVCIVILLMPKVGDTSDLPESIPRISYDIKLWTAFILGMCLVLLIKT